MEEQKSKVSIWSKIKKSKKTPVFLSISFLAVLILVFVGIYFLSKGGSFTKDRGRVVFTIENENFYENELRDIVRYPVEKSGISEEGAFLSAFEAYKVIVVAKRAGITPAQQEVESLLTSYPSEEVRNDPAYEEKYKPWFRLLSERDAVYNYIDADTITGYTGYAFVFYFGQHIEYGDDYKPEGLNDPALIAQDRAYAKEKADYYYSQVKEGKISPEKADSEIKADTKLNNIVKVKNPFGKQEGSSWEDDVFYLSVKNYVSNAKNTGLSELFVGQGYPGPTISPNDSTVDLYYYFVILDEKPQNRTLSSTEFNKMLNEANTSGYMKNQSLDEGRVELTEEEKAPKTDAELGIEGLSNVQNR